MAPKFRHLLFVALGAATPAAAQTLEDLDQLEAQVTASLGAGIGEPGGPARAIDRRLRLRACPQPATVDEPVMGAVAVRCQSLGWRIRVPLTGGAAAAAPAPAQRPQRAEPVIRRGDQVELVAITPSFTVRTSGTAEQDGAPGDRIRIRTEGSTTRIVGQVLADGRVALPGFN